MDVRTELKRLGFERVGAMLPVDGGSACKASMDQDVRGFIVYAHVVEKQIKKFGITKAPLRHRVGQNASTITQVLALWYGRVTRAALWHQRPLDAFKRMAPEAIKAGQTIEVWAAQSTEAEYRGLERELNARFDTIRRGWAMQLG